MSLYLRRIAIDGFRKFREPMAIEGLTDGLNIVIEPNETGKSTVLEALRAVRERVAADKLPLLSLLQADPLQIQSSHLSFQEYYTACAIREGRPLPSAAAYVFAAAPKSEAGLLAEESLASQLVALLRLRGLAEHADSPLSEFLKFRKPKGAVSCDGFLTAFNAYLSSWPMPPDA